MFFNNKELEKKAQKINDGRVNFFRPFNSAFERTAHVQTKQKKNFNHNGLLNNTDLPGSNQVFLHDFTKSQASVDSIKVNEYENSHVIAGKRALYKACEL